MKNNIIYFVLITVCCHLAEAQNGGEWKVKSSLTTNSTLIGARFAPVGFSINGKGYYGTGSIYNQNDKFKDFWSYDPITDRWTQIADFGGTARSSCFAFALNGNGYVGGGKTNNGCSDEMFVYYPSSNSWGSYGLVPKALTSATGRAGAFATAIQEAGSAYIGGGGDTEFNAGLAANYYKDFWEFKPSRYDVWRRLPDMPNVNKDAAIVGKQFIPYPGFLAQQLYVFCGDEKGVSYTNKVWRYQGTLTQNGIWDVLSTSYPGGNILRPVAFKSNDDNYYVGSGLINVNNLNYSATNNFYKFNPTSQTFCEVANLPEARFGATGFAISNINGNKGYILGGLIGNPINSNVTYNTNFEYSSLAITTTAVSAITTCTSLNLNFTADCSYSGNITAELVTVSGSTVTTVSGVLGSATANSSGVITLNFNSTIKPGLYRVRLKATSGASLVSSPSSFVLTITNATTNLPPASISLFGNVCSGRFIPASITSSLGINYTWTVSGGAVLIGSSSNLATIAGISNTTFSIRVGRLSTLCGISDIISTSGLGMLTSNTPSLSGPSQFCTNQTVVYSGGSSGHANGGYYQISKIGVGTLSQFSANQANFISSVAGVVTLNCSFVSACPSNATTPLIATIINTIPTNLSILGSNSLCANTQNVYTIPIIPNATYVWSVTGAASIIASSSNNCTLAGLGAGSFLLSVRISNFCGTITNTLAGISSGVLAIPTIVGCNTIQIGNSCGFTISSIAGITYKWIATNGLLLNQTNGNTVTGIGNTIGVKNISVTSSNAFCTGILATYNVTVIPNTDIIAVDNQCDKELFMYNTATTGNLPFNYLTNGLSGNFPIAPVIDIRNASIFADIIEIDLQNTTLTFDGHYLIKSNNSILFKNGSIIVMPGSVLYLDMFREPYYYSNFLLQNVSFKMFGSTLTGSPCIIGDSPTWFGITGFVSNGENILVDEGISTHNSQKYNAEISRVGGYAIRKYLSSGNQLNATFRVKNTLFKNVDFTDGKLSSIFVGNISGMDVVVPYEILNNTFIGIGAYIGHTTSINIKGNSFIGAPHGVRLSLYGTNYNISQAQISCNNFANGVYGISIPEGGSVIDQGTSSQPAGNIFSGNTTDIHTVINQSYTPTNFNYWHNPGESNLAIPGGGISLQITTSPSNCASNGYNAGSRLASVQIDIEAIKDSVRYQSGTISSLANYTQQIIKYYQNDLVNLERYAGSIRDCNRYAYLRLCTYLIAKYQTLGNEPKAAEWKNVALAANPNDLEIKTWISLFELNHKMSLSNASRINTSDSTLLVSVAAAGTSTSDAACSMLKLFYTNYKCKNNSVYISDYKSIKCLDSISVNSFEKSINRLNIHPNPTEDLVLISYLLPEGVKEASIIIYKSFDEKILKKINIFADKGGIEISTKDLDSGLYFITIEINKTKMITKKMIKL